MSIMKAIIEWSKQDLPTWQSDAVRRILTKDKLTDQDEEELLYFVKETYGLDANGDNPPTPRPLKDSHIPGGQFQERKITLKAIKSINNVNAIDNNSSLLLGHKGISVIYGENGAGKSGYARILKRACKARDSQERILSNVFESESKEPIEATFKISQQDEKNEDIYWKYGEEIESPLSQITVFDSKSANIILDGNNEVAYLPNGAHVFHDLVQIIRELRSRLEKEKPNVKPLEFKDIHIETKAGRIIKNLTHLSESKEIIDFAFWDEIHEDNLKEKRRLITDAELNNPIKQAKKLRSLKERMDNLIEIITAIENSLSKETGESIKQAINDYLEAEKAVKLVQDSLTKEPLNGVGESSWQILYNSAKDFSTHFAYPNQEYPFIENDSKCVLCMQELSEDAKKRMIRFNEFMENKTKEKESSALNSLEVLRVQIQNISIPTFESIQDILNELDDMNVELADKVKEFLTLANSRKTDLIEAIYDKDFEVINEFTKVDSNSKKKIIEKAKSLECEAQKKEEHAHPESLDALKSVKEELIAKKIFTERKDEILSYLKQLKKEQKYLQCINDLSTRAITQKGKAIVSEGLTPKLSKSIADKLKELGATHLALKLKSSGSGGQTRYQLQLQEKVLSERAKLSEILSEGEQRVVALAGFLAELESGEHECPIVLDDPVTSLDHRYREKIAKALIKESKKRQVIVFTHDLSFLFLLEAKATEAREAQEKVYFHAQTVRNTGNSAGKITNSKPWHAMNVKDRVSFLNREIESLMSLYRSNINEYNKKAGEIYGLLRETWESLVERDLLYESVFRFSQSVQTQRLKSVTVTTEDYIKIFSGMNKCSKWMIGHDKSASLDFNRPCPDEVKSDLVDLDNFGKKLRKRHADIRRERDESLKPKSPDIG